jgi:hypothetical protein
LTATQWLVFVLMLAVFVGPIFYRFVREDDGYMARVPDNDGNWWVRGADGRFYMEGGDE